MDLLVLIALYLLASAGMLLSVFLALEVAAAVTGSPENKILTTAEAGPVVVVIPAHNEGAGVKPTLANILPQLRAIDLLLVVADNCSDDTAAQARGMGAEVVERNDPSRKGKGYALQFALDYLRASPPEIVVFTDADCLFEDGALQRISTVAAQTSRPAQALYLMKAPEGAGPRLQVAEFAWAFINNVRMRGLQRLFDVTRFTGAGFAAPWSVIEKVQMGSAEIVEDLALTMQLIRLGASPLLVEDARVESVFPGEGDALTRQSARWSIGSLRYGARASLGALGEGVKRGRTQQIGAALDLMLPPLTVFIGGLLAITGISLLAWLLYGEAGAFGLSITAMFLTAGSIVAAWSVFGREILPPSSLRGLGEFLLSKAKVFGADGRKSAESWTPTRGGSDETER